MHNVQTQPTFPSIWLSQRLFFSNCVQLCNSIIGSKTYNIYLFSLVCFILLCLDQMNSLLHCYLNPGNIQSSQICVSLFWSSLWVGRAHISSSMFKQVNNNVALEIASMRKEEVASKVKGRQDKEYVEEQEQPLLTFRMVRGQIVMAGDSVRMAMARDNPDTIDTIKSFFSAKT